MDEVRNGHAHIVGDQAHHLTKVLRVEAGQQYEISDNRSVYLAEVETARKQQVVFRTLEKLPVEPAPVPITLCAALIRFDRFEWMIEKATELGVAEIVPVVATRSERGLDKAASRRLERWRRIAQEASQQSRRAHLPEIREVRGLREALEVPANYRYVLDEERGGRPLAASLPEQRREADAIALLVGPEGGWTEAEREQFGAAATPPAWTRVSMGPLILRAETAAIAAVAVAANAWLVH